MANEITVGCSLAYSDAELTDISLAFSELTGSISTKKFTWIKQNIGTSEEALILGEVSSLGWFIGINRDSTNFVELRVSTGSTKFAKMKPLMPCLFYFGSGVTAPYAIADTATCQIEYILLSV